MKKIKTFVPLFFGLFSILLIFMALFKNPYKKQAVNFDTLARLPVVHNGRIKPLDTFARNNLKIVTDKQTFKDSSGKTQPALRWYLDVVSENDDSRQHPVFRVEHDGVLALLKLQPRSGFRYSLEEIADGYQELVTQAMKAFKKEQNERDLFEVKVLELFNQLEVFRSIIEQRSPLLIAPLKPGEQWLNIGDASKKFELTEPVGKWLSLKKAYRLKDYQRFDEIIEEYSATIKANHPGLSFRINLEILFNRFQPFYQSLILYVLAFLLIVFSWMFWRDSLIQSGLIITVIAIFIHTIALIIRMYLQDRPPVTNLYSSAIFVGWIAALLGLCIEWYMRNGFGTLMTSVLGFTTLIIAQNLSGDGDTMEMMRAVLDTNFWLATHVTTVTIGYSATFLAGFMGMFLVLQGVFTKTLEKQQFHAISQMIYGTVAFATIFSFVGTVLGGIWADQSWGRFWGWDPKENGALMIVLWNAMILHARWGGIVKKRGVALLAIFGNIITAWSWFGVNMLGVGLHSYGFTDAAFIGLSGFVLSQLIVIAIGLLPEEKWRSPLFNLPKKGI